MTPDTATSTPATATASHVSPGPPIATAWMVGGATWIGAGLIFAGDGWRYATASATWFVSDLLLLAGLVWLFQLGLHGGSRVGSAALGAAIFARVLFAAGEVATIASGHDEGPLIPLGALLTGFSLTAYAATILRRHSDRPICWALLAMGLYPFLAMFPVLAITGEPNYLLIALWGLPAAVVGLYLCGARRSAPVEGPR